MSQYEQFRAEVDKTIGAVLAGIGAVYERHELNDRARECRLYYRTRTRELYLNDARLEGDINCWLRDNEPPGGEWITVWAATGYGEGLSLEELVALHPVAPRSYQEVLLALGDRLLMLSW